MGGRLGSFGGEAWYAVNLFPVAKTLPQLLDAAPKIGQPRVDVCKHMRRNAGGFPTEETKWVLVRFLDETAYLVFERGLTVHGSHVLKLSHRAKRLV